MLRRDADDWAAAQAAAPSGEPILIATSVGGFSAGTIVESILTVALALRGARVHVLLCDEILPACMRAEIHQFSSAAEYARFGPRWRLCRTCYGPAERMFRSLGVRVYRYGEFVTPEERREAKRLAAEVPYGEIGHFRLDGLAVGEHALAGALRFYARGNVDDEPEAERIVRRYFHAALLTAHAVRRLLATHTYARAVFHHGIYVPQGIVGEVARAGGVPVVNWNPAYRKQCFIFSHGDTYHHTLLSEPTSHWDQLPWTPEMEHDILDYLKSRWHGTQDWIWFHEKPREDLASIAAEIGVDFSRPTIGLLTNVMWDAQLHYRANAFPSMLDWTLRTIQYFQGRPDLQLVVRIHPAEIRGTIPSRQPLLAEIQRAFPQLPPNVYVIPPESQVSTYAAMLACNAVIIYGTKTGVELTSLGIPVIVAGEAWIRNKGLTLDASSSDEYFELLGRLPLADRLPEEAVRRARQYAYHFFFRRMIPLPFVKPVPGQWPPYQLELSSLEQLMPGQNPGLDVLCDGILTGREFIYPAEQIGMRGGEPVPGAAAR